MIRHCRESSRCLTALSYRNAPTAKPAFATRSTQAAGATSCSSPGSTQASGRSTFWVRQATCATNQNGRWRSPGSSSTRFRAICIRHLPRRWLKTMLPETCEVFRHKPEPIAPVGRTHRFGYSCAALRQRSDQTSEVYESRPGVQARPIEHLGGLTARPAWRIYFACRRHGSRIRSLPVMIAISRLWSRCFQRRSHRAVRED